MIDSHCHLDHEPLLSDIDNVIIRSKSAGVTKILTICTTLNSFDKIKKLELKDKIIYGTYGIHPHETKNDIVNSDLIINEISNNDKIIGVGETGLDFYYDNSDKETQIKSFETHIKASIELNIPLIIHSRSAENETFDILNNYKNDDLKILMHCFTGSQKFAEKLLDLNAYFSASGIITFKNSLNLQKTFMTIPNEKLLIETDSPYLAPVPLRGKKNEPSYIKHTLNKLGEIKKTTIDEIETITSNNFNLLFNLK